jgi:tetratricopeptide (TPR) repeat protein
MSSRIAQWIGLIGITATIPLVQTVATAKSSVEVAETARTITVLITDPNGENGSGVILKHEGDIYTVITSAHVVDEKLNYQVTTPDDKQYQVISNSIMLAPGDIDLAVVKFKATTNYPTAKLGNCNILSMGMDLYVSGFPARDRAITSRTLVVREGKISANSKKTFNNGYSLIYSNDTLKGMSGGAVLNTNGELVAIHGLGNRDADGRQNGFNLGIPIERFGTVASRMGVELNGQVAAIPQDTAPKADDFYIQGMDQQGKNYIKEAIDQYTKAITLNPTYSQAYAQRGNARYRFGDRQGAISDYTKVIEFDSKNYSAYFERGYIRDQVGDKQGALKDFQTVVNFSNNSSLISFSQPIIKRLQTIDPTVKNQSDLPSVDAVKSTSAGDAKSKNRDYQGAINEYDRAIALAPQYAVAYIGRGQARNSLLDQVGASEDFNRAIAFAPSNADFYIIRGNARFNWQDQQAAMKDFNKAISLNPKKTEAYFARGSAFARQIDRPFSKQAAIKDYSSVIALDPRDGDAYFSRGEAYFNLGKYQAATNDFSKAISLYPDWPMAFEQRGNARSGLGDKQGKLADFQKAAALWKQRGNKFQYEMISRTIRNLEQCGRDFCRK